MLSQFLVFGNIRQTLLRCAAGTDTKRKDDPKNTNRNTFLVNGSLPPEILCCPMLYHKKSPLHRKACIRSLAV
jgi:hypothetical protein